MRWKLVDELCQEGHAAGLEQELGESTEELLRHTNEEGLLPLHTALIYCQPLCVAVLLKAGASTNIPFSGLYPVHLAFSSAWFSQCTAKAEECLNLLLEAKADLHQQDRLGRTALHLAAAFGMPSAVTLLLEKGASPLAEDFRRFTPVHTAISFDQVTVLSPLLRSCSTLSNLVHFAIQSAAWRSVIKLRQLLGEKILEELDLRGRLPSAVASECGYAQEFAKSLLNEVPVKSPSCMLITDEICMLHGVLPLAFHTREYTYQHKKFVAENPYRFQTLLDQTRGILHSEFFHNRLLWNYSPQLATLSDLQKVHQADYVAFVKGFVSRIEDNGLPQPLDPDTFVTSQSYQAALRAAGAVLEGIDTVVIGTTPRVFCCVRPPGHHIGVAGAVDSVEDPDTESLGYCVFNNVAVGAAYALSQHRRVLKRVAIVDFDVHHGNGTEQIIRRLKSGAVWLCEDDCENMLFISSHAYGQEGEHLFYPGSGQIRVPESEYPAGVLNIPCPYKTNSASFRKAYIDEVFPRLLAFKPDLLLLSAGFDGHELDKLNHGFMQLDEADFSWLTEKLVEIANQCCEGRLVSVLEGGYNLKGGVVSPLAQSVAAHVEVLSRGIRRGYTPSSSASSLDQAGKNNFYESQTVQDILHEPVTLAPALASLESDDYNFSD